MTKEIEQFAKKLLDLTGGRAVPRHWKHQLARALEAQPMRRGRKVDTAQYAEIVKDLAERTEHERAVRTKASSPATKRREIAKRRNVSEKTVLRIEQEAGNLYKIAAMPAGKKKNAAIEGLAQAVTESIGKDNRTE